MLVGSSMLLSSTKFVSSDPQRKAQRPANGLPPDIFLAPAVRNGTVSTLRVEGRLVIARGIATDRAVLRVDLQVRARASHNIRCNIIAILLCELLGIVVHDNSHAAEIETIGFGHHSLSESVRNVVRAEKGRNHACELEGDKRKRDNVPVGKDSALKSHVAALASGKVRTRVASLGNGRLYEGAEVSTAVELVLDTQTPSETDAGRPLSIDLSLEVEGLLLVGDVSGSDEKAERDPKEKGIDSQESAVVEQNSRPTDQRGKQAERGGNR